jgi:hypothetical protein
VKEITSIQSAEVDGITFVFSCGFGSVKSKYVKVAVHGFDEISINNLIGGQI